MRVAFLTLDAYDALTGGQRGNIGGAQVQQVLIGKELSKRGHDVVIIENDAPYKDEETIDGIEVVLKRDYAGYPFLQRQPVRAFETVSTLRTLEPDICYRRGPNVDTLGIALYCSLFDSKFVYGFAHDKDMADQQDVFDFKGATNDLFRKVICSMVGRASVIIVQNEYQYRRANQMFNSDIIKIENGYPKPNRSSAEIEFQSDRPVVFWAATFREWKQPDVVLEVAMKVPAADFLIAGGRADECPELYDEIKKKAKEQENVTFVGYIPYEDIDCYFAEADVFLNTSTSEGFPNTFLQAWAHKTPVISLNVDPNSILREHNIGYYADGDLDQLISSLRTLIDNSDDRTVVSENAYEYFVENHSIDAIASRYEDTFSSVLDV